MKRKFKVMVNNSTYINKTNNHLPPQTIDHQKKPMTFGVRNPGICLGRAQKCGRDNQLMGSQPS
jgi:hypothetical protein